jgi:hypothetical protein
VDNDDFNASDVKRSDSDNIVDIILNRTQNCLGGGNSSYPLIPSMIDGQWKNMKQS